MDPKKGRKLDINMKQVLEHYYRREEQLRLAWFRKNESRLMEIATKEKAKVPIGELKEQLAEHLRQRFQHAEKFITPVYDDDKPMSYDKEKAGQEIMKPVDPEVKQLLYKGTEKEGRANYLKKRYQLIPELRYYYPETTSFVYGWKMWDCAKEIRDTRYGKQQVIRDSFYRRRGVDKDPDWYIEPQKLSPTVCGCI